MSVRILVGDCLERLRTLPEESVLCAEMAERRIHGDALLFAEVGASA